MSTDYETWPISRADLRFIAKVIRKKLHIESQKIPVIKLLDVLEEEYNVLLSIEGDDNFKKGVVAFLTNEVDNSYTIHVAESVYDKACEGDKSSIGFICHEMCHYFLIEWFGRRPIYGRILGDKYIERFRSMEWQAKALCGELMIPYDEFPNSSIDEIMKKTDSSFSQAEFYMHLVQREKKRGSEKNTDN